MKKSNNLENNTAVLIGMDELTDEQKQNKKEEEKMDKEGIVNEGRENMKIVTVDGVKLESGDGKGFILIKLEMEGDGVSVQIQNEANVPMMESAIRALKQAKEASANPLRALLEKELAKDLAKGDITEDDAQEIRNMIGSII